MRTAFLAAMAALLPMAPPWIKLDEAFAAATTGDKLIAVYSTIGADGSREDGSPDADAALASKAVAARYGEYFWVRAADLATAKRIDAPSGGSNLIFLDPDGGTVGVYNIALGGEPTVLKALDDVKLAYIPKSVPWFEGEPDEKDTGLRRKLIVYAFLDEKEASEKTVKALEHPWVARDHNRLTLVRKYVLDSPLAKRFKVTSAPTLIFFDAAMKDGKQVVERKTGEVTPRMIRAPMRKFFERVKKEAATAK